MKKIVRLLFALLFVLCSVDVISYGLFAAFGMNDFLVRDGILVAPIGSISKIIGLPDFTIFLSLSVVISWIGPTLNRVYIEGFKLWVSIGIFIIKILRLLSKKTFQKSYTWEQICLSGQRSLDMKLRQ